MKKTVLVVDDDPVFSGLVSRSCASLGLDTHSAASWAEARALLERVEPNLVILDYKLPDTECGEVLPELSSQYPVIVLTGFGSIRHAVSVIRGGATDYLTKPVDLDELELTIRRTLDNASLANTCDFYRRQLHSLRPGSLIGDSTAMRKLSEMIDMVAPTDATVLIQGESGTGKEMVARAIHEHSRRAERELVTIDSCGLQESLFESELFGHERGAFTGAERQKKGLIEEATGGTLFLDEIGDVSPAIQAKLLRVIETGTFRRLGGNKTLNAEARFIVATNRDLQRLSREGGFRIDLFFRLSSFTITVPPLRERRADIPLLARHFVVDFSRGASKQLSSAAEDLLMGYDWPGNVRELRNVIERAVILTGRNAEIGAEHLAFAPSRSSNSGIALVFDHEPTLDEIEARYLRKMLRRYGGLRYKAANALGISERHAYRLIEKYGLRDLPETDNETSDLRVRHERDS